jgi:hypothetical protein
MFVFFMGRVGFENKISSYHVSNELVSLKLLHLIFIDTRESIQKIRNPVLINTKSYKTHWFLLKLIFSVLKKIFFLKRKKFFYKILQSNSFLNYFFDLEETTYKDLYVESMRLILKKQGLDRIFYLNLKKLNK